MPLTYQVIAIASAVLALSIACAAPASAEPPVSVRALRSDTVVEADGRAVQTFHFEVTVGNDAAAHEAAQQALTYTDRIETVELVEGATIKPDGRRLVVQPSDVHVQLAPGTPGLPEYSARKRVTAVLPDAQGGDVLSVTWRRTIERPIFPGYFADTRLFNRTLPWDDIAVSVSVPDATPLAVETRGPEHSVTAGDGRTVHRWQWHAAALASDPAELSPLDRVPAIFASTFPDWAAFSRIYAGKVAEKAVVTPRIQAQADAIVGAVTDRREQTRLLYEWVSRHVRWVAVYVLDGDFVPHAADTVLANGYGDCKDQVTLLVALLRAREIAAEPVLVNFGPTYTLSEPVTLTAFNHVIAYVPELELYADSTAGGAPFGTLPAQEYGKPILHVTQAGAPPTRMAVLPAGLAHQRLRTVMRLDTDGRVTGESTMEAAGPYATLLRQAAGRVLARGGETAATDQLQSLGHPGHGNIVPAPLDPIAPDYSVSATFALDARPGWLDGDGFAVPAGMRLLQRAGDGLIGPLAARSLPIGEPTVCYAGEQEEDLSLALPPGYRVARLPRSRHVADATFSFDSTWSSDEGTLHVTRHMLSRVDQPLCTGALRTAAAKALDQIRRDFETQVTLEKDD